MVINLSQEEIEALTEMGVSDIEGYLKSIVRAHLIAKLDDQFAQKTYEEKKSLLTAKQQEGVDAFK